MGWLGTRGTRRRPGYAGGTFMTSLQPSGIVASIWPRRRPGQADRWMRSIHANFASTASHVAHMHDREVDPLRQALIAFNNSHEGLRGTASIRLEDLLTQLGFGRLWAYRLPDGRTVYSRAAKYDVSRRLDWLEPMVGSILTRTDTQWLPTNACVAGANCRLMPSIPIAGCCPPASVFPNTV